MIPRSRRNLLFASEREGFVFGNADMSLWIGFEAPRMGLNLIFIKVSAAPTGALGPWKVEEP